MTVSELQQLVDRYFTSHMRDLPWRRFSDGKLDAYHVLVSEFMLQQTQAARVIPKYEQFLTKFPTVKSLAKAPLSEVLKSWSGLGYNRRAKYLWQAAQMVVGAFEGDVPESVDGLMQLPGVGPNTAGAIYVYSFNKSAVFIETNVRTVFLHHLFADRSDVPDSEIAPLLEQALKLPAVARDPRRWYWALMDYGVYIKSEYGNASRRSKHHVVQSKFAGSRRQARGVVLRELTKGPSSRAVLQEAADGYHGFDSVLEDLLREGLIEQDNHQFRLAESDILTE